MTFQFYPHFQVYHHLAQNEKSSVGTPQPHIVSNMALLHCIKHSTPLIHFPFTAATLYLSVPLSFWPQAFIWSNGHSQSSHYPSLWFLPIHARQRQLLGRPLSSCIASFTTYNTQNGNRGDLDFPFYLFVVILCRSLTHTAMTQCEWHQKQTKPPPQKKDIQIQEWLKNQHLTAKNCLKRAGLICTDVEALLNINKLAKKISKAGQ